jgi:hypothetical protein
MPENYPKESIQHLEHGESLKSRKLPLPFKSPSQSSPIIPTCTQHYLPHQQCGTVNTPTQNAQKHKEMTLFHHTTGSSEIYFARLLKIYTVPTDPSNM